MRATFKPMVILLASLLSACSGNPLQHKPIEATARILMSASNSAMNQLGFKEPSMSDRYRLCMTHRMKEGFNCEALYQAMADTLLHQGIKVRPAHLNDKAFYQRIAVELEQQSYFSL